MNKILLDANLSYRLKKKFTETSFELIHVTETILQKPASDIDIWNYAKHNEYSILTLDEDFAI